MTDIARVKITAESPASWATKVEVNGVLIPVCSVEYKVSIKELATVTLTFPAIIDLDVALQTGKVVIKQGLSPQQVTEPT